MAALREPAVLGGIIDFGWSGGARAVIRISGDDRPSGEGRAVKAAALDNPVITEIRAAGAEVSIPAQTLSPTTAREREKRKKALKALEDGELLRSYQQGDETAFYVLFERRQREIFTHCFRMCNGDRDKASDAFQDTFVKVFTKRELFTDTANGRAWLYRIATNTCLNSLRYDRRHPKEQLDVAQPEINPAMQPDFSSEQQMLRTEMERAIAKLPMELREPFLLKEIEEFSYEEISEQLGLTVAACRQRVYRAKQMLREELQDLVAGTSANGSVNKGARTPVAGRASSMGPAVENEL
jgi:RNA polymerase sigma-70 factor (ECF subfamily)